MKGVVETGYKAVGACKTIVWSSVLSRWCVCVRVSASTIVSTCREKKRRYIQVELCRYITEKCSWPCIGVCAVLLLRYRSLLPSRMVLCVRVACPESSSATSDHCHMRNLVLSKSLCPNFKTFSTTLFYWNEGSLPVSLVLSHVCGSQFGAGFCRDGPKCPAVHPWHLLWPSKPWEGSEICSHTLEICLNL